MHVEYLRLQKMQNGDFIANEKSMEFQRTIARGEFIELNGVMRLVDDQCNALMAVRKSGVGAAD